MLIIKKYRRHKYGAKKVTVNGIKFDSKKEASRYKELMLLMRCGEIKDLELQPKFELIPKFKHDGKNIRAGHYIADFKYFDNRSSKWIVEDTKGYKTQLYNFKKKLFLYQYGEKYKFLET